MGVREQRHAAATDPGPGADGRRSLPGCPSCSWCCSSPPRSPTWPLDLDDRWFGLDRADPRDRARRRCPRRRASTCAAGRPRPRSPPPRRCARLPARRPWRRASRRTCATRSRAGTSTSRSATSTTGRSSTARGSGAGHPGVDDRSCSPPPRRWRRSARGPVPHHRARCRADGSSSSAAVTRSWRARRRRPRRDRTRPAPTSTTSPRARRRPWPPRGVGTRPARLRRLALHRAGGQPATGRRPTCPRTWSRRSPPCGPTRARTGRPVRRRPGRRAAADCSRARARAARGCTVRGASASTCTAAPRPTRSSPRCESAPLGEIVERTLAVQRQQRGRGAGPPRRPRGRRGRLVRRRRRAR